MKKSRQIAALLITTTQKKMNKKAPKKLILLAEFPGVLISKLELNFRLKKYYFK